MERHRIILLASIAVGVAGWLAAAALAIAIGTLEHRATKAEQDAATCDRALDIEKLKAAIPLPLCARVKCTRQ